MFLPHIITTLVILAAAWKSADLYSQASGDASRTEAMTSETTPKRPPIDLAAPADFQTATFALG